MNFLLTNHMSLTFATFSGMVLASSSLVGRQITAWKVHYVDLLILGIIVALSLVTLPALKNSPDSLWYMFIRGMIGITAMILPGISGAFILPLSHYHFITESIKGVLHGELNVQVLVSLTVFAVGCLTGLLSFSRVLKWLLSKHCDSTMAVLCGFMLGSLYKLWPFQQDTTPEVVKFKHKIFQHYVPDGFSKHVLATCGTV